MEYKDLFIIHSLYQGYWCPGDSKESISSSHCIDLDQPYNQVNDISVDALTTQWDIDL